MATMYIERSGGCRRRASSGDVIEPWFVLSRSAYQRILDVALADMTSTEVLQRACSSSPHRSELLRLLSSSDDVTAELSLQPSNNDNTGTDSPVENLTSTACEKSYDDVGTKSPNREVDTLPPHCLPLPLIANRSANAGDCRRRLDWSTEKDLATRLSVADVRHVTSSSKPVCLRVPSYSRSQHTVTSQSAKRRRPVVEVSQNYDVASQSWSSLKTHSGDDSKRTNNDVRPTSLTTSEPLEGSQEQHQVEILEFDGSKCGKSERKSSKDTTRKRKSQRQPETEIVREDGNDGDGWAPIDKDILVSIVERLSVSCLQPSSSSSSSSSSSVQTEVALMTTTSTSSCEFRQPLTLITATPPRRDESSARTKGSGGEVTVTHDVIKRPAILPTSLITLSSSRSDDSHAPPHKTQRLRTSSPALMARTTARRKSSVQRRVQVRDTWNVPADKSLCCTSTSASAAVRQLMVESVSTPRHVWAPLEKSVVLNVIDHILVDGDVDDSTDTSRRCELQSTRRRWLEPPSLRLQARTDSDTRTTNTPSDHPITTATEASFKWKSNILRRIRKEQTVVATSSGRWIDLVSGAVAATGS